MERLRHGPEPVAAVTRAPVVSVVIPAHNDAQFLRDALDSALAQTFDDYEVVVVDDGSTDETPQILAEYAERHPACIRAIRQDQSGASAARNRGIRASRGEFVAFLDADDMWLPSKIEKQVAAFRSDPSLGLVTTCHEGYTDSEVVTWGHNKRDYLFADENLARAIVIHSNLGTPTVMVPRAVLDDVGLFDEDLAIAEDDNLWIRITARYPARLVDEVLVRCRLRPGSLSTDGDQLFRDVMQSLDRLMDGDPVIRERIRDGVPIRKSRILWDRGYDEFARGDNAAARRSFLEAIRHQPSNGRAWAYLAVALLPAGLVRQLRRLRGG